MSTAIQVENLSKKYILNHQGQERYLALRDVITNKAKNILNPSQLQVNQEEFWALKDLNFEIKQGDRVGIIGRNGAGKSTLLKILSRITEPTTGKIKLKGRVASLLEVGTGFHPELTGRENIFLNGAILGMSKWEIKRKFDEIVAFAEVEKFLDTPVKRYSSGMYVRLAFAVAAHLEPEILIVDEVLAVGDAQFQKKCLGRMEEVGKEGRTVIFVSHNMEVVKKLCSSYLYLEHGKTSTLTYDFKKALELYLDNSTRLSTSLANFKNNNEPCFKLESFYFTSNIYEQVKINVATRDSDFFLIINFIIENLSKDIQVGYAIYDEDQTLMYWSIHNDEDEKYWPILKTGLNTIYTKIPTNILNTGRYRVELIVAEYYKRWIFEPLKNSPVLFFDLEGQFSTSPFWIARRPGVISIRKKWSSL